MFRHKSFALLIFFAFGFIAIWPMYGDSQERRSKIRISNAGFTITALPLLAAKDWGVFAVNGLDVELIVMSPSLAAAALAQGDIDYVAGVGPASVAATLSGLASRAIWFSSDRISLLAPGLCAIQIPSGTQRQEDRHFRRRRRNQPCRLDDCNREVGGESERLRHGRDTRAADSSILLPRIRLR